MRRTLIAAMLLAAACASTKEGNVAQLQTAYTEAAQTLVNLRKAEKIDDATWAKVKVADAIAFQALEDYKAGVATRTAVLNALNVLENYMIQGVK